MKPRPVPDIPPRAVLYLRQSQYREESVSYELQEAAGRDYCARMGYVVVGVEKDGSTGRVWKNRPGVQRCIQLVEDGDADVIVLWKWSRLSRNRVHWAVAADTVDLAGGRIESSTEPIDTSTASGRFARGVMTEYAAFQSEQIGETWEEVRQRRLRTGRPASGRLPWGWAWGDPITCDPEKADIIREMYARYIDGWGSAQIARWLNARGVLYEGHVWERQRPFTVMDSPIHAGLIPYRGNVHEGAHEGIIDRETWDQYTALRRSRFKESKPRQSKYLLSGLARCQCGRRIVGKGAITGGIWYSGYICLSMDPDHGPKYVSSLRVDPAVKRWLVELADDLDARVTVPEQVDARSDIERLEAEWSAQQKRIDRLTVLLAADTIAEASYLAARSEVESRQGEIDKQLRALRAETAAAPVTGGFVRDFLGAFDWMPAEERHNTLRAILSEVRIEPGETATMVFRTHWGASSVMTC